MPPVITRQRLDGATVLTIEDHCLPVVRFAVALRRGAMFDPPGEAGATRTLLELMLRGTQQRSRVEFNAALEELGSSLSAVPGSETAFLRGASLRRNLEPTLELLSEALSSPALSAEELEPLIEETVDTLRADRDDDDSVAELFMRRALYPGHALARSPLGEVADLERLDVEVVRHLHQERFGDGDLVFAFAGDVTPELAREQVAAMVARLPRSKTLPPAAAELPDPPGLRILVVDKPERTQVQLRAGRLTLRGTHVDAYPFWLAVMAFGGTFTSPFTQQVRDVRGWSYVAQADFARRQLLRAPLVLRTAPAVADAVDCLALELELYRELAQGRLANDVVERTRSYLLNRYPFEVATAADMLFPVVRNELLGFAPEEIFATPKRLQAITVEDVGRAAQEHLRADDLAVVMVATASTVVDALRQRFPTARVDVVDFKADL